MPSYLITGASRGLGLAFTAELLKDPNNVVVATARNTAASTGLHELSQKYTDGRLLFVDLDVINPESVTIAAEQVAQLLPNGLDHFISNAGISSQQLVPFEDIDIDEALSDINFNIKAPILLLRAFLPIIRKGSSKKILIITSVLGSINNGYHLPGLANVYGIAKASLNMLARKWAATLKDEGITTILVHPGWVGATDMGVTIAEYMHKYAPSTRNVPEEESAAGCMKLLNDATIADNGEFFNYDGNKIPF